MSVSYVLKCGLHSNTNAMPPPPGQTPDCAPGYNRGLWRKRDNDFNSGYVGKWETWQRSRFLTKKNLLLQFLFFKNDFVMAFVFLIMLNTMLVIVFTIAFS